MKERMIVNKIYKHLSTCYPKIDVNNAQACNCYIDSGFDDAFGEDIGVGVWKGSLFVTRGKYIKGKWFVTDVCSSSLEKSYVMCFLLERCQDMNHIEQIFHTFDKTIKKQAKSYHIRKGRYTFYIPTNDLNNLYYNYKTMLEFEMYFRQSLNFITRLYPRDYKYVRKELNNSMKKFISREAYSAD